MKLHYILLLLLFFNVSSEENFNGSFKKKFQAFEEKHINLGQPKNKNFASFWNLVQVECLIYILKHELKEFQEKKCEVYLPMKNANYVVFALVFIVLTVFPIISWIIYRVSHEYEIGRILNFSLRKSGIILGICWILKCLFLLLVVNKLEIFSILPMSIFIFLTGLTGIVSYIKRSVMILQVHVLLLIGTKLLMLISTIFIFLFFSIKNSDIYNRIYYTDLLIHPIHTYVFIHYIPFVLIDFVLYMFDLIVSLNTLSVFRIGGTADECMSAKALLENSNSRWTARRFLKSAVAEYIPHFHTHKLFKNQADISSPYRYDTFYHIKNKKNLSLGMRYNLNFCDQNRNNKHNQTRPYSCSDKSRLLS